MWLIEGVVANVVTLIVLYLVGRLVYRVVVRTNLKDFFHLGPSGLVVYASRLAVMPGGSLGRIGLPLSYGGDALPEYELESVNKIERFLSGFHPTSNGSAGVLGQLRWQDTSLEVKLAPAAPGGNITEPGCLISIGSPGYNTVSQWIETRFPDLAVFTATGEMAITGAGSSNSGEAFIVQRAIVPDSEICVFYCAGLSVFGTTAAVDYLLANWKILHKRYEASVNFALIGETDSVTGLFKRIITEKSG